MSRKSEPSLWTRVIVIRSCLKMENGNGLCLCKTVIWRFYKKNLIRLRSARLWTFPASAPLKSGSARLGSDVFRLDLLGSGFGLQVYPWVQSSSVYLFGTELLCTLNIQSRSLQCTNVPTTLYRYRICRNMGYKMKYRLISISITQLFAYSYMQRTAVR